MKNQVIDCGRVHIKIVIIRNPPGSGHQLSPGILLPEGLPPPGTMQRTERCNGLRPNAVRLSIDVPLMTHFRGRICSKDFRARTIR